MGTGECGRHASSPDRFHGCPAVSARSSHEPAMAGRQWDYPTTSQTGEDPRTGQGAEEAKGHVEQSRRGFSPAHAIVAFTAAVAIGNILGLRRRLLHIERMHTATHTAGQQRQRVRTAQEEYARAQARQQRSEQARAHAEEDMRREARYQYMKSEEEKARDRFRRAYARWQRETSQHQQQEQQHQYWDGRSFGHGWSEEEERRSRWQQQANRGAGRERSAPSAAQHWQLLGLDRNPEKPFSSAEIKAAFRKKAMEHHPDVNQGDPKQAEQKFRQVLDAYHALSGGQRTA
eukprot:TRINITY_DN17114_c0_g1_i1.p1 TRINITY_DN17114_c0_g1~~TRINITY_DN17114_c0_g1_i1.p1  ORF type:complete len:289 (+),score=61.05 TRINITY_DN17114_c0_g1_i1:147-1013(+)